MMRSAAINKAQSCFRIKQLTRARVVVPAFILFAAALHPYYCEDVRQKRLRSAFDKGAVTNPGGFYFDRPKEEEKVRRILQPEEGRSVHATILGNEGTGKTSLVRHVGHQYSGVIYIDVSEGKDFDKSFAGAINWSPPVNNWVKTVYAYLTHLPKGLEGTFRDGVFSEFERQAKEFQQKNKRPAVLVLDHIEYIAKSDPVLLAELLYFAKKAANNAQFTTVFVTNKNNAKITIDGPRLVIGDLTCDEALDYLRKYRSPGWTEAREVYQLIGGRIRLLAEAAADFRLGTTVPVWKEVTLIRAGKLFKEAKMLPGGANHTVGLNVARRILSGGPLAIRDYYRMIGCQELADELIASEIFSDQHSYGKITFQSKLVESFAKSQTAEKI